MTISEFASLHPFSHPSLALRLQRGLAPCPAVGLGLVRPGCGRGGGRRRTNWTPTSVARSFWPWPPRPSSLREMSRAWHDDELSLRDLGRVRPASLDRPKGAILIPRERRWHAEFLPSVSAAKPGPHVPPSATPSAKAMEWLFRRKSGAPASTNFSSRGFRAGKPWPQGAVGHVRRIGVSASWAGEDARRSVDDLRSNFSTS